MEILIVKILLIIILIESLTHILVYNLKKSSQWLITDEDILPTFNKNSLDKFTQHGFDSELGWVRKSNTDKEEIGKGGKVSWYHINSIGARINPQHESLSQAISCYGDSFVFARQINDGDTFEWYLSELTKTNVLNFGVGNYGLDQALLRLKREYPKTPTKIVIMGVVPSTIVRILSVWKHYNEFGNIYGFKPRFILQDGKLKLIKNIIDTEDKFLKYKNYLPVINKYDYFYETKFKKEIIKFPYLFHILKNPARNIPLIFLIILERFIENNKNRPYPLHARVIMKTNLKLRVELFGKEEPIKLMEKLIEDFLTYSKEQDFTSILLWMPQKDDLLYIRKYSNYYMEFIDKISQDIKVIDLTPHILYKDNLDSLYCDDSHYGGHFSEVGNKLIAEIIYKELYNER